MIDRQDAASALASVESARRRSSALRSYAGAGDALIGWGVTWLGCNLYSQFDPVNGTNSWLIGIPAAILWSYLRRAPSTKSDWRFPATAFSAFAFFFALVRIAEVQDPLQANAMVSLCVALSYVVAGIWRGLRFAGVGVVLAALILGGWFFDRAHLYLWLGLGGGGALIVSGLWLRRA